MKSEQDPRGSNAPIPPTGLLSVVVPLLDEAEAIGPFWQQLASVIDTLTVDCEVWFVDDGSTDGTGAAIEAIAAADHRVGVLTLSRNFGHQMALTAALDHAHGDWIVCLDGDGQHPPELIPEFLVKAGEGFDIVVGQRDQSDAGFLKRLTSSLFYRLLNRLSRTAVIPDAADFRLLSRRAADALRNMRENHRFLRGMVGWVGFRTAIVTFDASSRLAGRSKYSALRMLRLAKDALFSFSLVPLRVSIVLGVILVLIAAGELGYTLWLIIAGRREDLVPGWTSLIFAVLGVGGVQLITLGVIGQYVGMIFEQVKNRPLYVLRSPPIEPRKIPGPPAGGEPAP